MRDLAQDDGHLLRSVFAAVGDEESQETLGRCLGRMLLRVAVHSNSGESEKRGSALVGQLLALCWNYEMSRAAELGKSAHLFMRGNGVVPKLWRSLLSPQTEELNQDKDVLQSPFDGLKAAVHRYLCDTVGGGAEKRHSQHVADGEAATAGGASSSPEEPQKSPKSEPVPGEKGGPSPTISVATAARQQISLVAAIEMFLSSSGQLTHETLPVAAEAIAFWILGLLEVLRENCMAEWPAFFRLSLHFLGRMRPAGATAPTSPPPLANERPSGLSARLSTFPEQMPAITVTTVWPQKRFSGVSDAGSSEPPLSPATSSTFSASFALEGAAQPHHIVALPIIMLRFVTPQVVMFSEHLENSAAQSRCSDHEDDEGSSIGGSRSRQQLTFLAKVLQKIANGQCFDGPHEASLRALNAHTTRCYDSMLEFAHDLATLPVDTATLATDLLAGFSARHALEEVGGKCCLALEQGEDLVTFWELLDAHFCAIVQEMNSRRPLLASLNHWLVLRASNYAERRLRGVGLYRGVVASSATEDLSKGSPNFVTGLLNTVRRKSFTTSSSAGAMPVARSMVMFACRRLIGEVDLRYSNQLVSVVGLSTAGETVLAVHGDMLARSWELFNQRGAPAVAAVRQALQGFTGSTNEADVQSCLLFWLEIAVRSSRAEGGRFRLVFHCPQDAGSSRSPLGPNWLHNWVLSIPEEWSARCTQVLVVRPKVGGGLLQSLLLKAAPGGGAASSPGEKRPPAALVAVDSCAHIQQLCPMAAPKLSPTAGMGGATCGGVVPVSILAAGHLRTSRSGRGGSGKLWSLQTMRDILTFLQRLCDGDGAENAVGMTTDEAAYVRRIVGGLFWTHVVPQRALSSPRGTAKGEPAAVSVPPSNNGSPDRGADAAASAPAVSSTTLSPQRPSDQPCGTPTDVGVSCYANLFHYPADLSKSEDRRAFDNVVYEVLREPAAGGKGSLSSQPQLLDVPQSPAAGSPAMVCPVSLLHCPVACLLSLLLTNIARSFTTCLGDGSSQRSARSWSLIQKIFYSLTFTAPVAATEAVPPHGRVHAAVAAVLAETGTLTIGQKLEVGLLGIVAGLCILVRQAEEKTPSSSSRTYESRIRDLMFSAGLPPGTPRAVVDELCSAIAQQPQAFLGFAHFFAGSTMPAGCFFLVSDIVT